MSKYKNNLVPLKKLKELEELIGATQCLLYKMKKNVQDHIDYHKCQNEFEYQSKHGVYRPSNADVVNLANVIRSNMLDVKKVFE